MRGRSWYHDCSGLNRETMDTTSLRRLFPGTYNFFRVSPEELRAAIPDAEAVLPLPQSIFLASEEATPLVGFPVLMNETTAALREALEGCLQAEERLQVASLAKRPVDRRGHEAAWRRYQGLLERATENSVRSSFGRRLAGIFWLYHSIAVSRLFKEMPRRILRLDLKLGRTQGDTIRFRVYEKFVDRVMSLTYDVVHHVAEEAEEEERELFPALLQRMRDNVLILAEDHISFDLSELDSYFRGYLRVDGKDFRARLARLESWLSGRLREDTDLRSAATHLVAARAPITPRELIVRSGYVRFLSNWRGYDPRQLLDARQVQIWESLLLKLKEFEILVALRRRILPVRESMGALTCQASYARAAGLPARDLTLSASTRPFDFMTSWVVDPMVRRCGLIYDITDFSAIVSYLGRSGTEDQDSSYRSIFRFQRWVNQMARFYRLQLEKYLGDGALYSGRHPSRLLIMAIELQRYYQRALNEGFPFDRGLRIALNYGEYRLLPIEEGDFGATRRYEFFGHGIVELTRLVTGKTMREINEIKNLLIAQGYSPGEVEAFFAPAMRRDVDLLDRAEEDRRFYCYINPNGTLVNEGIAATERFITQLDREDKVHSLSRAILGGRRYVVLSLESGADTLLVGIRKLGFAKLKGLEQVPIFEVVDGEPWRRQRLQAPLAIGLLGSLEKEFIQSQRLAARSAEGGLPQ